MFCLEIFQMRMWEGGRLKKKHQNKKDQVKIKIQKDRKHRGKTKEKFPSLLPLQIGETPLGSRPLFDPRQRETNGVLLSP
jgi:hypothetical protein